MSEKKVGQVMFGVPMWVPKEKRESMDEVALRIAGRGEIMRPCTDDEIAKLPWVPKAKDGTALSRPMKLVTEDEFLRSLVKTFPTDVERRAYSNECRARYQQQLAGLRRNKDLRVRKDGYIEFLVDVPVDHKPDAK